MTILQRIQTSELRLKVAYVQCYYVILPVFYLTTVKKTELTTGGRGIRCADHATPSIRKSWH
jgi:hypothetical protein